MGKLTHTHICQQKKSAVIIKIKKKHENKHKSTEITSNLDLASGKKIPCKLEKIYIIYANFFDLPGCMNRYTYDGCMTGSLL